MSEPGSARGRDDEPRVPVGAPASPDSIDPRATEPLAKWDRPTRSSSAHEDDAAPAPREATQLPARFGDYELIRKLGEGGMGEVYLARQLSLGRLVALKRLLPGRTLGAEQIARLKGEAQAAAALEHQGIVPIHEIGEHEGRPYISLGYVEGFTLAKRIAVRPLPPRQAVDLMRQVAEAVHFAHERGVIHRDLKPGNILLDMEGRPRIADFGLAKRFETKEEGNREKGESVWAESAGDAPSGEGWANLTATGQVLGTPAYMPPEQASGNTGDIGPAADIYALGATLYHMLTGRPPFQAATWTEIRRQILELDPAGPRALNPAIPRDLETIALKCLAKTTHDRYASARDLAEDLARFQRHEPVIARPVGRAARAWRWCKRKPATAAVALLGAALILVLSIGAPVWAARESRLRAKAQAGFEQANRAVQNYVETVKDEEILADARWQPMRKRLLADARSYYEEFVRTQSDNPDLTPQLAQAFFDLGFISSETGDKREAAAAMERSCELFAKAVAADAANSSLESALARSLNELGTLRWEMGAPDRALECFDKALSIRRRLAEADANHAASWSDLAASLVNLGGLRRATGDLQAALANYNKAIEIQQRLGDADGTNARLHDDLAASYSNAALLLSETNDPQAAEDYYRRAIEIQERLVAAEPSFTGFRNRLGLTFLHLGVLQGATGETQAALENYGKAIAIQQSVSDANPAVTEYQQNLASSFNNMGKLQNTTGDSAAAIASFGQSIEIGRKLAAANPAVTEFQSDLSTSYQNLGVVQTAMGDSAAALANYGQALEILGPLAEANPTTIEIQSVFGQGLHNRGILLGETGDSAAALESLAQAVAIRRRLVDANPTVTEYKSDLARSLYHQAIVYTRTGDRQATVERCKAALLLQEALVDQSPTVTEFQSHLAATLDLLGAMQGKLGERHEALKTHRKAIEILQSLADSNPSAAAIESHLALAWNNASSVQVALEDLSAARTCLREAVVHQQRAVEIDPDVTQYRTRLEMHLSNLEKLNRAMGGIGGREGQGD